MAPTGTVSCQPPATDSADGYLTAADHASFGAARTYTHSFAALAGQTFSGGNEFFHTATITIPANLSKLFVVWEGEWQGGTSSTPSTLTCSILLDNVHYASRHSTSSGGYADLSTSALLDVTAGTRHVGIDCSLDTGSGTIHNTNLTAIATE